MVYEEELKNEIEKLINDSYSYITINPEVYFFILYNPVFGLKKTKKFNFSDNENYEKFLEYERIIFENFENLVLSKVPDFLKELTRGLFSLNFSLKDGFENKNGNVKKFKRAGIRKIINQNLNISENKKFYNNLSGELKEELKSTNGDEKEKEVYYTQCNNYLFTFRRKEIKSIVKKFSDLYEKLDEGEKNKYLEFSTYLISFSKELFEEDNYSEIYEMTKNKSNGKNYFMPRFDLYGLRLLKLNQDESLKELNAAYGLKEPKTFNILFPEKDDHRKRVEKNRPGGIHHIFIDKAYPAYAFEFQFLDLYSFILTYFGENKDSFKDLRK